MAQEEKYQAQLLGPQIDDALSQMNQRIPEGWAVGQRDGVDVPSTSQFYHNNAKYYAEQASQSATDAAESAEEAADVAEEVAEEILLKAFVTDTAEGSVASFPDGADNIPVKNLTAQIVPIQDLHGFDYPWPEGSNLFDGQLENGTFEQGSPTVSDKRLRSVNFIKVSPGKNYAISVTASKELKASVICYASNNNASWVSNIASAVVPRTLTIPTGVWYIKIVLLYSDNGSISPSDVSDVVVKLSANICPISGWTAANIYRTGINVWDEEWELGRYDRQTGQKITNTAAIRSKNFIEVKPSTTYYFNASASGAIVLFYGIDRAFLSSEVQLFSSGTFTTPENCGALTFYMFSAYGTTYSNDISINYPATDTSYHAYNGTTYNIDWTDEAGTVYGGTLQYLGGGAWRLTKTMTLVDLGTLAWTRDSSGAFYASVSGIKNGICPMLCEALSYYSGNFQLSQYSSYADNIIGGNVNGGAFVYVKCTTYSTAAEFKTAMSGKYLSYTLATPTTYDLTGADVLTLLGANAIWADCGDVSVDYRADTKLYIDKKIAETQALILENA